MEKTKDRILGMLYGCAIGDSFGMPGEMWEPERIKKTFGYISDFMESPAENEISGGFKAGETTDDTIVAFITAEALIRSKGEASPLDIVNAIEKWSLDNPKSKTIVGPSTRMAFEAIHEGLPVAEAGKNGVTDGAGTKAAPVGALIHCTDYKKLAEKTKGICMATHNTPDGISGACAIVAAVSHGIDGFELRQMKKVVLKAAKEGAKFGYRKSGSPMAGLIRESFDRSDEIEDDALFMERQFKENGAGLLMVEAAPTALAIAYRCSEDILGAARIAANLGGDTDTIAAMACMIVGAHVGASSIEPGVLELVSRVNNHPFERVAEELFQLRVRLLNG